MIFDVLNGEDSYRSILSGALDSHHRCVWPSGDSMQGGWPELYFEVRSVV